MPARNRTLLLVLLIAAVVTAALPLTALHAQSNMVTVTVAVNNAFEDVINAEVIADLEAQVPGVRIVTVSRDIGVPDPARGLDRYYEQLGGLVAAADVLLIGNNDVTPSATLAGYYLDLAPLVAEDTGLNVADIAPAVWQSYQWDKGVWAMPFGPTAFVLSYQPSAFDEAGIAYPSESWTIADLDFAIRKLAQKDDQGNVTRTGLDLFGGQARSYLFRSLLGNGVFDSAAVPFAPQLVRADVETLLTTWAQLEKEGLIGRDLNSSPMSVVPVFALALPTDPNQPQNERKGLLLPGGKAALDVSGFAVSAGTTHPKEAYEVAKRLATYPAVVERASRTGALRGAGGLRGGINTPEEVTALNERAINAGIPMSELRFMSYVSLALDKMNNDNVDAAQALAELEAQAVTDQQTALDKRSTVTVTVATPPPDTTTADGRLVIKFGLNSNLGGRNSGAQERWNQLIADFIAADPQIGAITLDTGREPFETAVTRYDCFYMPYNAVPNAQLDSLLALDPFMDADATFDKADVVGNVLAQLSRDGKVWGYPILVEPGILRYNSETFDKAGAVRPTAGWTVDEFNTALRTIKVFPEDPAPFQDAINSNGTHLLILTAAYGGLPLDYRTDPPTIAFTDPRNVTAMQQVLDLAKQGYIQYNKLAAFIGGGGAGGDQNVNEIAIRTEALNALGFRVRFRPNNPDVQANAAYLPTTYPRGQEFSGATYSIGVGFISADSRAPEGCYRFLSAIANDSGLFRSMPARRSLLSDPNLQTAQGADLVALYQEFDRILLDPTTIQFPTVFGGGGAPTGFLLQYWLYQAWDGYVLEDKELEPLLQDAEQKAKEFQECSKTLPAFDRSTADSQREYIRAVGECAVAVDPTLEPIFALIR